jgi:hypothetical protein
MDFAEGGRAKFNEGALAKVGKVAGKTFAGIDAPLYKLFLLQVIKQEKILYGILYPLHLLKQ